MKKQDAPRLKRFIGKLGQQQLGAMPVKDMVQFVRDLEWLATIAEKLEGPDMEIKKVEPIEDKKKPLGSKKK